MSGKSQRVNVGGDRRPLSDSPFAALAGTQAPPAVSATPQVNSPAAAFRVGKTRQGGWPLRLEKRPGGKVATVLERIEGDGDALLTLLRKRCATGGAYADGVLTLQGDHQAAIAKMLDGLR